jgi:hypothetical protein
MAEKFTDILTYVLSVALAAGVITFAAYKVIKLNGMENPPANMGLNFPPLKRKVIIDETAEADPITTQSLGKPLSPVTRLTPGISPGEGEAVSSYRLLTVVDGVAFIELGMAAGTVLIPVTVGTRLPGGYRVESIERQDGRWVLVAGSLKLGEQQLSPQ